MEIKNSISINEIFYSIQGEAKNTGKPTIFIRTAGCPYRCTYCDTEYAFTEGVKKNVDQILDEIKLYKTKYIYDIGIKLQTLYNSTFHIDHIIPLKGITFEDEAEVCGLNVYYNLMPVTENINESKKNFCPPAKQIKNIKINHLSLDQLPSPKDWIKFIDQIYLNALKSNKSSKERALMQKNYIETNPRLMKK